MIVGAGTARAILLFVVIACSGGRAVKKDSTALAVLAARPATPAADTEIVRAVGVPTALDDTAPNLTERSQYGRRTTPHAPPLPPCAPAGPALCITDTATVRYSTECCIADQRQHQWLIFARQGDSIQLFTKAGVHATATLQQKSSPRYWREAGPGADGSWLRFRFPRAGTYSYEESLDADTSLAYELRVIPVIATGATRPTGEKAELVLTAPPKSLIAVIPRALASSVLGADYNAWAVGAGSYAVLLVRGSEYVACVLPCASTRQFVMKAGRSVTVAF